MADRIQNTRDTAANFTSVNPTLPDGQIGYDKTNRLMKVGDGSAAWNSLPYIAGQFLRGAIASRPAAATGNTGLYYISSDQSPNRISYSTGSAWVDVGGGTSTDPHVDTSDPTTDENQDDGYLAGTRWVNTTSGQVFILANAVDGKWNRIPVPTVLVRTPLTTDDRNSGYRIGDLIIAQVEGVDDHRIYGCVDDAAGGAIWRELTPKVYAGIGTTGEVPDPGAGADTRVLQADGTWAAQATGQASSGTAGAVQLSAGDNTFTNDSSLVFNTTHKSLLARNFIGAKTSATISVADSTHTMAGIHALHELQTSVNFTLAPPASFGVVGPVQSIVSVANTTGAAKTVTLAAAFVSNTDIPPSGLIPANSTVFFVVGTNDGGTNWYIVGDPDYREYTEKTTPANADLFLLADSADSFKLKAIQKTNLITGVAAPTNATYVTLTTNATLTDERTLAAGTGISLTDAGAGATATLAMNIAGLTTENTVDTSADFVPFYDASATAIRKTAITNLGTGGGGGGSTTFKIEEPWFVPNAASTSVGLYGWLRLNGIVLNSAGHFATAAGVAELESGTTAGVLYTTVMGGPNNTIATITMSEFSGMMWRVRTNSVANVMLRFGLFTPSTTEPTNGVYYNWLAGTDTNWQAITRAASTSTITNTGVTVNTATWYTLSCRKSGSNIVFKVNGSTVGTVSTNLPDSATNLFLGAQVIPSTTAAVNVYVDHTVLETTIDYSF